MPNDKLKFWVKCPECKKAFGVFPRAVLQYLNRLIEAHGFDAPEPQEPKAQETPARVKRRRSRSPTAEDTPRDGIKSARGKRQNRTRRRGQPRWRVCGTSSSPRKPPAAASRPLE